MILETKFNIGDTVYGVGEREPLVISRINIETNENKCSVEYLCNGNWYLESKLTAERPKPKSVCDLKDGYEYFVLLNNGNDEWFIYNNLEFDRKIVEHGFDFPTKEEVEKEARRIEIHRILKKLAGGYKFNPKRPNYLVAYSFDLSILNIKVTLDNFQPNVVYFETECDVRKAIDEIGTETLIRDYFGVED